jgi:hypothetical protein
MNCVLSPADVLLYTTRLTEAEKAYHDLVTGGSARVVVDQNGQRVEFTAARKTDLYNYIMSLKSALGVCSPIGGVPSGPATFYF